MLSINRGVVKGSNKRSGVKKYYALT